MLPLAVLPKMIDHAARLDDDGYHIVKPAKKSYPAANFVGRARRASCTMTTTARTGSSAAVTDSGRRDRVTFAK